MSSNTPDEMSERRRASAAHAQAEQDAGERFRSLLLGVGAVILIGAVVAGVIIFQGGGGGTVGVIRHPPKVTTTAHGIAVGRPAAPVHVVVYEDFLDRGSTRFEMGSRDYLHTDAAAGRVYVEYRPIARADQASTRALNAFAAVLDTAGPKAALKFHDLLFDQQSSGTAPAPAATQLVSLAVEAGARRAAAQGPVSSLGYQQWVDGADAAASKAHVRTTPSVLVGGTKLPGTVDQVVDELETRIAKEG